MTLASAIRAVLDDALSADPSVMILGDTVGRMGGHAGATAGLLQRHGPDRVRDLPVADRGTLGLALGLALAGRRPVVELAGTNRLFAALDVLDHAAAVARRGDFAVPLVVRVPWGTEAGAADRPVGQALCAIDGLSVVAAADPGAAAGLLRTALSARGPVVLLEPRALDPGPIAAEPLPFRARVVREGVHLTVAAWGAGVPAALRAADALAEDGHRAEVVDLVAVHPLDRETLGASVRRTGRLVAVHPRDPALADVARAIGLDEAFLYLESPLARADDDPERIARAARGAIAY